MLRAATAAACCLPLVLVSAEFDHSAWDRVLAAAVSATGEVDYGAVKKNPASLDDYVRSLAASSPDNRRELFPSRDAELAYWLNAYNALVMSGVVKAYPTKSVRDLGLLYGFFRRKDYQLGGAQVSLLSLENDVIRKRYRDARIHFAIVCASLSCPRLDPKAFTEANLGSALDRLTRQFLAERRNLEIDAQANTIHLSALFDWYKEDFGGTLEFVKKYVPDTTRARIESMRSPKLRYRDYDWSINDPGSRARAKAAWERELAGGR